MANVDKLVAGISEWLTKVGVSILPKVRIPSNSWLGNFMRGAFGFDLSSYNVWNELGFLLQPTIDKAVAPIVARYVSMIPDEQIQDVAMTYVDAFIKQASEKGSVNLFGIELGVDAFEGLKGILMQKFNISNIASYE
jgi:hypothetical protein